MSSRRVTIKNTDALISAIKHINQENNKKKTTWGSWDFKTIQFDLCDGGKQFIQKNIDTDINLGYMMQTIPVPRFSIVDWVTI